MTGPAATTGGRALAYDVVDVFAAGPFAGNQLAVVHGADGLSTAQLQAIAREFGFSETTFPTGVGDDGYDVRIFTVTQELPFAGHPTLGTAWVLRDRGLLAGDAVRQRCGAGEVPVRFADDLVELSAVADRCEGPLPAAVAARLLDALGLDPADGAGDAWITSTGLAWTHLPVTAEALGRARTSTATFLDVVGDGWSGDPPAGVALVAIDHRAGSLDGGAPVAVRSRVFSMDGDTFEDPATGSAAACLGVALVARGLVGDGGGAEITQGVELGRPSRLFVRVDATDGAATVVHVAGRVHPVARGEIRVPPV